MRAYRVEVSADQDELRTYLVNAPTPEDARNLVLKRIEDLIEVQVYDDVTPEDVRDYDDEITWRSPVIHA